MSDHSFVFKSERPWPNQRLGTAAIVGHTTERSTRLWVRTGKPGNFALLVYPTPPVGQADQVFASFRQVPFPEAGLPSTCQRLPFQVVDWSADTTHLETVTGLDVDTEYRYALLGPDEGSSLPRILLGQDEPLAFRTQSADPDHAFRFALFSCHMPFDVTLFRRTEAKNEVMWQAFRRALERHGRSEVRLVLGGGDQVYSDGVDTLDIWKFLNARIATRPLPSLEEMRSWYRDVYRGYWGFDPLRRVFASFPTYMIWDDHEIADGWGSHRLDGSAHDELDKLLPDWKRVGRKRAMTLVGRMVRAAKEVYREYEHSHNPETRDGVWDYSFTRGRAAFYVLDGRGHRDFDRPDHKILGAAQHRRFDSWLNGLDPNVTPYVFVVSAVPLIHLRPSVSALGERFFRGLWDDLRDHWEHPDHKDECRAFTDLLFAAADRGFKISVLSGDVHISAAFRLQHQSTGRVIYQLTSSAITYEVGRVRGFLLGRAADERGTTQEGHRFERVALYTNTNFSMVRVDPRSQRIEFRLYGRDAVRELDVPDALAAEPLIPNVHSIATVPLEF